ncbi:MAG: hypothetical protein AB7F75_01165 [Planctomycetota bacterium]
MKPIFTVHAGEFVVADYIEKTFKRCNLWVPSRDTGIDLLVTNSKNNKAISLQVKFSRDFLTTHFSSLFQKSLRACGWWSINQDKLAKSKADYWVFVVVGFERRITEFIVIKPKDLLKRIKAIHGNGRTIQCYLNVTANGQCWESRGLKRKDQLALALGDNSDRKRDFSTFLNNWGPIQKLNGK